MSLTHVDDRSASFLVHKNIVAVGKAHWILECLCLAGRPTVVVHCHEPCLAVPLYDFVAIAPMLLELVLGAPHLEHDQIFVVADADGFETTTPRQALSVQEQWLGLVGDPLNTIVRLREPISLIAVEAALL